MLYIGDGIIRAAYTDARRIEETVPGGDCRVVHTHCRAHVKCSSEVPVVVAATAVATGPTETLYRCDFCENRAFRYLKRDCSPLVGARSGFFLQLMGRVYR